MDLAIKKYLVDLADFLVQSDCPCDMRVPVVHNIGRDCNNPEAGGVERLWILPGGAWVCLNDTGENRVQSSIWLSENGDVVLICQIASTVKAVAVAGSETKTKISQKQYYWAPCVYEDIPVELFELLRGYFGKLRARAQRHLDQQSPSQ